MRPRVRLTQDGEAVGVPDHLATAQEGVDVVAGGEELLEPLQVVALNRADTVLFEIDRKGAHSFSLSIRSGDCCLFRNNEDDDDDVNGFERTRRAFICCGVGGGGRASRSEVK